MTSATYRSAGAGTLMLATLLIAFSAFAAWRVIALTQAQLWAASDPARALGWVPDHPQARLALAEAQLAAADWESASATARRLLAEEPLQGRAFSIVGQAAAARGEDAQALALYQIAARRSPRDVQARAWLADHALAVGNFSQALQHMESLLLTSPGYRAVLMPLMAQMAADPVFATELARVLERRPSWRADMLATLQRAEDPRAADTVLSALRSEGGLTEDEFEQWLANLIRQGRWGDAYGRWVGTLELADGSMPLVYNGGFEKPVSSRGFDWHQTRVPGVALEFIADRSSRGLVAHAAFGGRPVAQIGLEQPLLLGPGRHRFGARIRADVLRSERGLEWSITCLGQNVPFATSASIQGTFAWREIKMEFEVPSSECEGQWLRLRNPVRGGSIQQVSGDLWFDDVAIQYLSASSSSTSGN